MKKKNYKKFTNEYFKYCEKQTSASLASSISAIYLKALFTRLFLLYSNVHRKQATFYFFYISSENLK